MMPTLAIDYGSRRIGIAVSDSDLLATPHSVIRNEGDVVETLARISEEVGADTIVVGVPRLLHNQPGQRKFEDLAEKLQQKTCKRVVLWDESFTTIEAERSLRAAGRRVRETRGSVDMYAAAVILQSYLDWWSGRTS